MGSSITWPSESTIFVGPEVTRNGNGLTELNSERGCFLSTGKAGG